MNKRFYYIALIYFLCSFAVTFGQSIDIKKIREQLPKLLGANNIGTEFVFGFHPCWEEMLSQNNAVRIYVSSPIETEVRLTIPYFSDAPIQVKKTRPNDIIEFILTPATAQPYARGAGGAVATLLPTQVFPGRGIILESDAPVVVYGVTRFAYTSDGFLALPVHALGKEYSISSYRETANFVSQSLTPYADVIGVYPKTKVSFFFGGNNNSRIRTLDEKIWKPFEVLRAELNRGDFWLIASEQASSDLGGSFVIASQPVAVLSGNHCAYVPTQLAACDFIIEQELPTNTWGTKYYVSPILDRKKASLIRVFCKEGPTTVYRDGVEQFTLFTNWGLQEEAWCELRANPDTNKAEVYHSDKQIYVVQYNTGQNDDNVLSDPFQLVLTPLEQFQKEILFNTPGIRGGFGFQRNYINIIFQSDFINAIPDDIEMGEIMVTGQTVWKKIKDISSSPGQEFDDPDLRGSQVKMYSKTIKLPYDAVYKLRAKNQNIAAYAYGFASYDSYGFPTSMAVIDLMKNDTLPPVPYYELTCQGNTIDKKTYVIDVPDNDTVRANLAIILFDKNNSFNYEFTLDKFVAGESRFVKWGLKVIDPTQDAKAIITFADKRGNDTTIVVQYFAVKLSITPKNFYFGNFKIGENKSQQFIIKNESETSEAYLNELAIKSFRENLNDMGFTFFYAFDVNEPIYPKDTRSFFVTFTATKGGEFRDSIGIGDTCFFKYRTLVRAIVGIPVIQVSDIDFGNVTVGSKTNARVVTISNLGTTAINITGYVDKSLPEYVHNLPKITEDNPIIIEKGGQFQFELTFEPSKTGVYPDSIVFESDAGSNIDPVCVIRGKAIEPQLEATGDDWGRKRAHLARYDTIPNYSFKSYPAPTGAIVLKNDGTKEVTISKINVLQNIQGDAFEIMVNGKLEPLINYINYIGMILDDKNNSINIIPPGSSVHLPVYFHPRTHGVHTLKIEYVSDAPKKAISILTGIGIYPKLSTNNLNYGSRIIGEPPATKSVKIFNYLWEFQDSVIINSFYSLPLGSINSFLSKVGSEGFAYNGYDLHLVDRDSAKFPIVLQPGDYVEIDGEFSAVKVGNASADLITNSDAQEEADSYWIGFGILEKLKVIGPEEEYYCFDPKKEFIVQIINDGTIGVPMPVYSLTLLNNQDNSFIIDRVEREDKTPIDFINAFSINPGDTLSVIIRYAPTTKPQPNVEEIHSCILQIQTNSVIPESRIFTAPIKLRTIRYTRRTESVINGADEITIDPGTNIDIDPINYSIYVLPGIELEMANPLDFHITISYRKNFIAVNQINGIHKIAIGSGLPSDWKVNSYNIKYDEATLNETITVHLKGLTPFKSDKRLELVNVEFLVFLPWHKPHDTSSRERKATILHTIESELACVDFVNPENVIANLKETCAFQYRTITINENDYFLSSINPNPVGETGTDITFAVPFNDFVEISISDSKGELVDKLVSKKLKAGNYSMRLPIEKLSSGIYFLEMKSGEFLLSRKFSVLK